MLFLMLAILFQPQHAFYTVRLYSGGVHVATWHTNSYQFGEDGAVSFRNERNKRVAVRGTVVIEEK